MGYAGVTSTKTQLTDQGWTPDEMSALWAKGGTGWGCGCVFCCTGSYSCEVRICWYLLNYKGILYRYNPRYTWSTGVLKCYRTCIDRMSLDWVCLDVWATKYVVHQHCVVQSSSTSKILLNQRMEQCNEWSNGNGDQPGGSKMRFMWKKVKSNGWLEIFLVPLLLSTWRW